MTQTMAKQPNAVNANDLAQLRWQVGSLISLIENQLYCISALNASDHEALREAHRKAYIEDLLSEAEIAQRGVYRIESRIKDLYSDYQMAGNDRVEKRATRFDHHLGDHSAAGADRRLAWDEREWRAGHGAAIRFFDRRRRDGPPLPWCSSGTFDGDGWFD